MSPAPNTKSFKKSTFDLREIWIRIYKYVYRDPEHLNMKPDPYKSQPKDPYLRQLHSSIIESVLTFNHISFNSPISAFKEFILKYF